MSVQSIWQPDFWREKQRRLAYLFFAWAVRLSFPPNIPMLACSEQRRVSCCSSVNTDQPPRPLRYGRQVRHGCKHTPSCYDFQNKTPTAIFAKKNLEPKWGLAIILCSYTIIDHTISGLTYLLSISFFWQLIIKYYTLKHTNLAIGYKHSDQ